MEHIVQFGISIDDNMIAKRIEENAVKQITNSFRNDVMKEITGNKDTTKYEYANKIKSMVEESVKSFLESNRDEIIEETSKKLADKLARAKIVRDMVNSLDER